eukprot:CAMPEP_0183337120 /NCGR_PEP_ID=MMETSP0164_2-20130417/4895_1 /TAXON_ID=221442 /ORGANISM="Coccolithus pelagicus ssp braarudi, Strain PLY182g" /LENGTH=434 /DNA_ID=CAMNT_0025506773 /DNA_START=41 /DNA_END=1345 /DNA_ORIENTATION=+
MIHLLAILPAALLHSPSLRHAPQVRMAIETPTPASETPTVVDGVVCARGVCVIADAPEELCRLDEVDGEIICTPTSEVAPKPIWPSALLLGCSVLYGTNFPLGRLMNDGLPASASTSARFVLAALALSPFLPRLAPSLRGQAVLCGCFTSLGYISQSIALVDTPASTVAFLGALTVVICPALSAIVDGRKLGFVDAPQTWGAAVLALCGVALLELAGGDGVAVGWGDAWSILQAVGFGTSFFLTEKMMARDPTQALPITATQCAVVAATAACWATADGVSSGWLLDEASRSTTAMPGLFLAPQMRTVAAAAAWTGLITTAANRLGETTALGRVSSSEASVLLATEPLWAALFAATLLGETLGATDAAGGALIVGACVCNAASPESLRELLGISPPADDGDGKASDTALAHTDVEPSVADVACAAVARTRSSDDR